MGIWLQPELMLKQLVNRGMHRCRRVSRCRFGAMSQGNQVVDALLDLNRVLQRRASQRGRGCTRTTAGATAAAAAGRRRTCGLRCSAAGL